MSYEVVVTPEQAADLIQRFGSGVVKSLVAAGRASVVSMAGATAKEKLLGQVLNRRTGTLIRSVLASPKAKGLSDQGAVASFGTTLDYGVAHELGFDGTVPVRGHTRRVKSRSAFGRTEGKRRKIAQGVAFVRAHDRVMHIRARRYLLSTLNERKDQVPETARLALKILAETGRPPEASELGM